MKTITALLAGALVSALLLGSFKRSGFWPDDRRFFAAAAAMTGLIAANQIPGELIPRMSVDLADALLRTLDEKKEKEK